MALIEPVQPVPRPLRAKFRFHKWDVELISIEPVDMIARRARARLPAAA